MAPPAWPLVVPPLNGVERLEDDLNVHDDLVVALDALSEEDDVALLRYTSFRDDGRGLAALLAPERDGLLNAVHTSPYDRASRTPIQERESRTAGHHHHQPDGDDTNEREPNVEDDRGLLEIVHRFSTISAARSRRAAASLKVRL